MQTHMHKHTCTHMCTSIEFVDTYTPAHDVQAFIYTFYTSV